MVSWVIGVGYDPIVSDVYHWYSAATVVFVFQLLTSCASVLSKGVFL